MALIATLLFTTFSGSQAQSTSAVSKPYKIKLYSKQDDKCNTNKNSDSCASIEISYPHFSTALGMLSSKQLNQYIQNNLIVYTAFDDSTAAGVTAFADKFISDYLENTKDDALSGNWERTKNIRVRYINKAVLSLQDDEDGYTGGAHGFSNTNLLSLNLNTGKPFKLNDILLDGAKKKLLSIGEQHFRDIHQLEPNSSLEEAGFDFDKNKFTFSKNFAILKKGLLFYYNSYDIASYATGPTKLFIPYNELTGLVNMDIIGL